MEEEVSQNELIKFLLNARQIHLAGIKLIRPFNGEIIEQIIKPIKGAMIDLNDHLFGSGAITFNHELLQGHYTLSVNKVNDNVVSDISSLRITELAKIYGYGEICAPMFMVINYKRPRCGEDRHLKHEPFIRDRYVRLTGTNHRPHQ